MSKTRSNFSQVPFGKIKLSRIFLTLSFFFLFHISTIRYSSLVPSKQIFHSNFLSEGLYSKMFINVSPLLQICSITDWYMTILPTYPPTPPTPQINLTSTIPLHPHATKLPRLTSSLRGTSLLWFSSVPSNHCLQSNLTLKPGCHILLLKILLRLPRTGSNTSPCSLTLHISTILSRYQSPK